MRVRAAAPPPLRRARTRSCAHSALDVCAHTPRHTMVSVLVVFVAAAARRGRRRHMPQPCRSLTVPNARVPCRTPIRQFISPPGTESEDIHDGTWGTQEPAAAPPRARASRRAAPASAALAEGPCGGRCGKRAFAAAQREGAAQHAARASHRPPPRMHDPPLFLRLSPRPHTTAQQRSRTSLLAAALLLHGSAAVSFADKASLAAALEAVCYVANANGPVNDWDVSGVTDMAQLFSGLSCAGTFNEDISAWDVSSVTTMHEMVRRRLRSAKRRRPPRPAAPHSPPVTLAAVHARALAALRTRRAPPPPTPRRVAVLRHRPHRPLARASRRAIATRRSTRLLSKLKRAPPPSSHTPRAAPHRRRAVQRCHQLQRRHQRVGRQQRDGHAKYGASPPA